MEPILLLLFAAVIFGLCYLVDNSFTKRFRSNAQHRSGLAVRVNRHYGVFGVGLSVIGVLAICVGVTNGLILFLGGIVVLVMGLSLSVYYLTHGIFYDGESFLVSSVRKKNRTYYYREILQQRLFLVQGGSVIIELDMLDGSTVSIHSTMEGVHLFLDTAFAGWCIQKGIDPQSCDFHDPAGSWWFPHAEENA